MIAVLNDGPVPARFAASGAAIAVGIENFDGSSAVSLIVSVTASEVDTRPAMLIGPKPHADIFTCAVAVAVSLPSRVDATTCHETGSGLPCTDRSLAIVKR